jgi:hypothetical protein
MNDDVYKKYCDSRFIGFYFRPLFKNVIVKSLDYRIFETSIAFQELKQILVKEFKKFLHACRSIIKK